MILLPTAPGYNGYFFYPLYSLAAEQLFRVADAAVTHKCNQVGAPTGSNFHSRINWLVKWGYISTVDADRWHDIRKLRNATSHPFTQIFITPGLAKSVLENIVNDINKLFSTPE